MQTGDYLTFVQALHRPGREDRIIQDYLTLYETMGNTKFLADQFGDHHIQVNWDEESVRGLRIDLHLNLPGQFAGTVLPVNQSITIYRSTRFTEAELIQMLQKIGFGIQSIVFDSSMDTALFLVEK